VWESCFVRSLPAENRKKLKRNKEKKKERKEIKVVVLCTCRVYVSETEGGKYTVLFEYLCSCSHRPFPAKSKIEKFVYH
jgi:hypothetical protein